MSIWGKLGVTKNGVRKWGSENGGQVATLDRKRRVVPGDSEHPIAAMLARFCRERGNFVRRVPRAIRRHFRSDGLGWILPLGHVCVRPLEKRQPTNHSTLRHFSAILGRDLKRFFDIKTSPAFWSVAALPHGVYPPQACVRPLQTGPFTGASASSVRATPSSRIKANQTQNRF